MGMVKLKRKEAFRVAGNSYKRHTSGMNELWLREKKMSILTGQISSCALPVASWLWIPFFYGRYLGCETWELRFSSHVCVKSSTSKRLVVSGRWWRSQVMSLTPPPMPLARAPGRVQPPHSLSQALHRAPCSLQPCGMVKGDFASSSQENIHHVFLLSSF